MVKMPNTTKILKFLQKKKLAVTSRSIAKNTKLSKKEADGACQQLRKRGLIGIACRIHNVNTKVYKTYWGVM